MHLHWSTIVILKSYTGKYTKPHHQRALCFNFLLIYANKKLKRFSIIFDRFYMREKLKYLNRKRFIPVKI